MLIKFNLKFFEWASISEVKIVRSLQNIFKICWNNEDCHINHQWNKLSGSKNWNCWDKIWLKIAIPSASGNLWQICN